ncbi:MAG TPA: glycosyltransferase family 4 protein [Thermoplasmata archaeon]|nr:glycosyltransferase family 4 protein [Thermoplasmata archaeon]
MRIAQVAPFLPERPGGSVVYSSNLALELEKRGHEVDFFAPNFPPNGHRKYLGNHIPIHTSRCYGLMFGVNPLTFLTRELAKTPVDVLHAHSYVYMTSNQAALVSRVTGRPFVLHIHGATYGRPSEMDRKTSAALYVKEKIYDRTLGRWTIDSADAIAAVSQFDLQQCREVFDVDESKLHLIPNAVDPQEFSPATGDAPDPPVVTYIGRLEPWKGAGSFLEIARLVRRDLPETVFQIAGDGSLRREMEAAAADLDGSVRFLGEVDHSRIADILRASSVLVLPSFIEGLPTVCLEALACGVPVVASETGGTSEVVLEGRTGYLCPAERPAAFAERVLAILHDPGLRQRMGRAGRALVEQGHSWGRVAELTERLYEQLV